MIAPQPESLIFLSLVGFVVITCVALVLTLLSLSVFIGEIKFGGVTTLSLAFCIVTVTAWWVAIELSPFTISLTIV